jgi:uncharacterized repeat protein (TIGR03806 family)
MRGILLPFLPFTTIVAAAAFAACGGGTETTGTGGSTTTSTTSTGTAGGGTGGTPPMPSPYGLDARPANTTCKPPQRPPSAPVPVRFDPAFPGLSFNAPMGITQIPGDPSRFFVFQRSGTVVSFPSTGATQTTTVLTVPPPINTAGEGGLLGFAFHPNAMANGHAFFSYTTTGGSTGMRSLVARMTSTDGGQSFGAYKVILGPFDQPFTNHDGGDAHFGPDGHLYLSFGDGGSGGDPLGNGQKTTGFFSKILRIDVDGGDPYAIPDGNPFKLGGGEPSTYAYGFRNPFRFSFDRVSGDLWVGDVGQNAWEEIDAKVLPGGNYGWNTREGKHCFSPMNNCKTAGLIDPIYDYDHTVGKSITGGVVYRGKAIPSFVGTYVFADFVSQAIWGLTVDPSDGSPHVTQLNAQGPNGSWVGFGEDNDGEVYAVDINGTIYKLAPESVTPPTSEFPDKLSKTGCFDPSDLTKPGPALIPYRPNSPLWSDGAEKERWFALPDGATITVAADGDFDFPIGAMLWKSFRVGGKLVETRLIVRHDDGGYAGYTYEWDADGKDATLLPANKTKDVGGGQTWYYPSRAECLSCHTGAAGRTLGLEVGQLNTDLVYPSTNKLANQLATLEHIGVFSATLPGAIDTLDAYPAPGTSEGTVETRARAYLHANCSFCHRPNGVGGGPMDLRFSVSLASANACGVPAQNGDLGIPGAQIIAPGDPSKSLLSVRPKTLGANRMPPIASGVVDGVGTAAIDAWISSLTSCP